MVSKGFAIQVLTIILIFLAGTSYGQDKLYIALDNEIPSKILKSELTRDWMSATILPDNESLSVLYSLNEKRKELEKKIVFVTRFDKDYPFLPKYPSYKLESKYKYEEFPPEGLGNSSWPLLATEALYFNETHRAEVGGWIVECKRLESFAMQVYVFDIFDWAHQYEVKAIQGMAIFHSWEYLDKIEKLYGNMPGFPVYRDAKYPLKPQVAMPWERDFSNRWQDDKYYSRKSRVRK